MGVDFGRRRNAGFRFGFDHDSGMELAPLGNGGRRRGARARGTRLSRL